MKYLASCNVYISDVYKVKADNEDEKETGHQRTCLGMRRL